MSKQRRTFSAEFKREAAALVLDQGYSYIDACRSLGVVDSALRRWVKQLEAERQGVTPKSKALYRRLPFAGGGGFGLAPLGEAARGGAPGCDPEEQGVDA